MICDNLLKEIELGREGKTQGYSMGLPKLEEIVDGVTRGTYTLLFAGSGIGKSSISMYAYLYRPLMDHIDDDNFRVTLLALEMKAEIILAKLLCTYIYETFKVRLSFKQILSRKRNYTLSDEHLELVKQSIPWMKKVEKILTIHDKNLNADSMYAILMKELQERGTFKETDTRKIYIPDNPDLIHIVMIDHCGLLLPTKGRTLKQEIDLTSHYLVTLRNMCNISPLVIMQSNRDQTSSARRQLGFFLPQTSDVKETNGPVEDAEIILAVYNPAIDKKSTYLGYNIKDMDNTFRSIVCLKNRYGESNVEDACVFYGDINLWRELPRADAITSYERLNNPDWDFNSENIMIDNDTGLANFNFTL